MSHPSLNAAGTQEFILRNLLRNVRILCLGNAAGLSEMKPRFSPVGTRASGGKIGNE